MLVTHYQRKPFGFCFSIEKVFDTIRRSSPPDVFTTVRVCPFQSRGIVRRLLNTLAARFLQGDINHITGDVHYIVFALNKHRSVLTVHDCVSLEFTEGFRRSWILWLWYRLPLSWVGTITTVSGFTRDEVVRHTGCLPKKIRVIHNPISDSFTPCPKLFNSKMPIILQVGTSEHNKNLSRVAEALRGISCKLNIIGRLSESQRQSLERNAVLYSNEWNLSDSEVLNRYRDCDMVVFASTYEGFGMPIIEANAIGRPVVTSNICSMPEVAGTAACLVDPFSPSSIRDGVLRVINDSNYRTDLIEQGYQNVKRFAAEKISSQYAALYRDVLSSIEYPNNSESRQ